MYHFSFSSTIVLTSSDIFQLQNQRTRIFDVETPKNPIVHYHYLHVYVHDSFYSIYVRFSFYT